MTHTQNIKNYLLKNPIDRSKPNCYVETANKFGVESEVIRRIYRRLRQKGLVESKVPKSYVNGTLDTQNISLKVRNAIKTLDDLIKVCEIDTNNWDIVHWECNKWEVGAKNEEGEIVVEPLFQVKAKLQRRKLDSDLGKQKDLIIKEMKAYAPIYKQNNYENIKGECLLEISLFDIHFGKLAHREETGEDYDLKIAETRFKKALKELLNRTNLKLVKRIFFPVGNDLIHVDNINANTFNGTPQDTDTRFHKIIKTVRRILIETIDELSEIAPVDVVIIPGNHDTTATFFVGEILDAWYNNNPNVTIDNAVKLRKYYKFGKNGFQLTHGDREKQADLGLLFATEEPKLWADTKFRFCQLGHFHKSKKINYISVDTFQGFQIQVMPSLSGTDAWHAGKGYNSLKQAKAFLYHPDEGLIAEYTYTT